MRNRMVLSGRWVVILFVFQMLAALIPHAASAEAAASGVSYYVSPTGSDSNPGTLAAPFATLEKARDAIRALKVSAGLPAGGVTVFLLGGTYHRTDTFALGAQDSGTAQSPIVYKAYVGEKVSIVGGATLPPQAFRQVTDQAVLSRLPEESRGNVMQIDLRAQGISNFGELKQGGFGWPILPPPPELFVNGRTMELGRWPNDSYETIQYVVDTGSIPRNGDTDNRPPIFEYAGERPNRWTQANDIWMFGYWFWDWADGSLKVDTIDTAKKQIKAVQPSMYGVKTGQRFYYYNLLEEIDRPGEWYLDRKTGLLYLYPPSALEGSVLSLSLLEKPLIQMTDVSYVEIRNLAFEASRGTAIEMSGGKHNLVADNTFRNLGMYAVKVNGGDHHGVVGSEIADTGMGAIVLSGGNRSSLTPGEHYAENNHIYRYARIKKTYSPAIELIGVGNKAAHNLIHDAPHLAILIHGNDHVIENNEIYDVLKETGDAGAIYMVRNWTEQGNVIRYNYIHDIGNSVGAGGQIGIYLDDMTSGTTAVGNILSNVNRAFLIGGGRNNAIENNLVIRNNQSLELDARGLGWASASCKEGGELRTTLAQMPVQNEPWRSRYPNLLTILDDSPCTPKYNAVKTNVLYDSPEMNIAPSAMEYGKIENNLRYNAGTADSVFMDLANKDYRTRYDSEARLQDFKNVDMEQIGLTDSFRYADRGEAIDRLTIRTDKSDSGESIVALRREETAKLEVKARTVSGFAADLSAAQISYSSDHAEVAAVDEQGVIHPHGDGIVKITAAVFKDGAAKSISLYVFVGIDALNKISVAIDRSSLQIGESMPLKLGWVSQFGKPMDLLADTVFTSSDPNVAAVNVQGKVTALAAGKTTITGVTYKDGVVKSASVEINVYERLLQSIAVSAETNILQIGEQLPLTIQATMTDQRVIVPTPEQISYSIENPAVIRIDGQGRLTALKEGRSKAEVKITINGLAMSRTLAFVVYPDTATDLPAPWSIYNSEGKDGFAKYVNGRFLVASNADNIWGNADNYTFVHRDVKAETGNTLSMSAVIESLTNTNKDAAAGIMFRESMDPGSKQVSLRLTPSGSLLFIYRQATGGITSYKAGGAAKFPSEIKLTREGSLFTAYLKANGKWQEAASVTVDMANDGVAGMTLFSHTWNDPYNQAGEAGFSNVIIEQNPIELSKVKVTAATTTLIPFQTETLLVKGYGGKQESPIDLSGAIIHFESSDQRVATVNTDGVVAAVAEGTAAITVSVTKNGITVQDTIPFKVTKLTLKDLDILHNATTLRTGQTPPLAVTGLMSNGTQMDLKVAAGVTLSYSSGNESAATIGQDGLIIARKPGLATITVTASMDGVTISKKIAVIVYTERKFMEDFEDGFAGWTVEDSAPVISSEQARSGTGSLKFNKDRSFITRTFNETMKGIAEVWFYDDGLPNKQAVVRIYDVIAGPYYGISQTHYGIRYGTEYKTTNLKRSVGWHQVIYDYVSEANKGNVYIDGELVDSRPAGSAAAGIKSITLGDLWADGKVSNVYFDDIGIYSITDTIPPVTTIAIEATERNGWYSGDPVLTLHAADEQTAVGRTEYSFDGSNWLLYNQPVQLEQEGAVTIRYRSTDIMGNTEQIKQKAIQIDRTAPDIQATVSAAVYRTDAFHAAITATDKLSGVAAVTVKLDGMETGQAIDMEPYGLSLGEHTIEVKAVDNAGNETIRNYYFEVTTDPWHLKEAIMFGSGKGWITNQGIVNSLLAKTKHFEQEGGKQLANGLKALENEIQAQYGKKIETSFAQQLLNDIAYLKQLYAE